MNDFVGLSGKRFVSLMIAVGVVAVGLLVGVPFGLISGYYGGKVDFLIQRVTDMMLAFPGFLLAKGMIVRILQRIAKKKVASSEGSLQPGNLQNMEGP